mmetsp:Transcript_9907/g.9761  ORF Transcript_9907/g.9761 Transcript_9907/m.9761 type:complete len:86 (+) Transcript_9907:250-507(+)
MRYTKSISGLNTRRLHEEIIRRKFYKVFLHREFEKYNMQKKKETLTQIQDFVYNHLTSGGTKCFDLIKGNDMNKTIRFFDLVLLY